MLREESGTEKETGAQGCTEEVRVFVGEQGCWQFTTQTGHQLSIS